MNPLTPEIVARLSLHAKIHRHLDQYEQRYRSMLERIERAELLAQDEKTYDQLVALKKELIGIRFSTDPSP